MPQPSVQAMLLLISGLVGGFGVNHFLTPGFGAKWHNRLIVYGNKTVVCD